MLLGTVIRYHAMWDMLPSPVGQLPPSVLKVVTVGVVGVVTLLLVMVTIPCNGVRSSWKLGRIFVEQLTTTCRTTY